MLRFALVSGLLLIAGAASAQVYKWTDASGTVHYSESAPPAGTRFTRIHTSGNADPVAPPPADESPALPATASTDNEAKKPMADTPENRTRLCGSLETNLAALKTTGPVVVMDQTGTPRKLDDEQRQQQLQVTQTQYQQYCQAPQ